MPLAPFAAVVSSAIALAAVVPAQESSIDRDEEVVLFPTFACRVAGEPDAWRIVVRGQVFEPEAGSRVREAILDAALATLDVTDAELPRARARLRPFLVDDERFERIVVEVGTQRAQLELSRTDGSFAGELEVRGDDAAASDGVLTIRVVLREGDPRRFVGRASCLQAKGVSIVSDIDDTVRLGTGDDPESRVRDAIVAEYRAVPGMADAYQALATHGAAFHWLTAAPWPLHEPYSTFLRDAKFPAGSLHMRSFALTSSNVIELLADRSAHKRRRLEELFAAFPDRRFVLIGDAVEADPECYGDAARRHPDQVVLVLIKEDEARPISADRLAKAFEGVPTSRRSLFRDPGVLPSLVTKAIEDADR